MTNDINVSQKDTRVNKKWIQLNQKQQIRVSTILRDNYINFVWNNNRKPDNVEKDFIVAQSYLELEKEKIYISESELRKYFQKRLPKYDSSIAKFNSLFESDKE